MIPWTLDHKILAGAKLEWRITCAECLIQSPFLLHQGMLEAIMARLLFAGRLEKTSIKDYEAVMTRPINIQDVGSNLPIVSSKRFS